ncbi:MAG: fumarate hydratase [Brumimicrobium sp.]
MIQKAAVISGDILASTSLQEIDRLKVFKNTQILIEEISKKYNAYCRITQGDYIECATPQSEKALEIALILKSFIKAILISNNQRYNKDNRVKAYKTYGIRIAIGYGELYQINPQQKIIDGEAVYLAGRFLKDLSTHDKERMTIKTTLNFVSNNEFLNDNINTIQSLIDVMINQATSKQCDVLFRKLLGKTESEIAQSIEISQPAVNRHSTSIGWKAIEQAVLFYEKLILQDKLNNDRWTYQL